MAHGLSSARRLPEDYVADLSAGLQTSLPPEADAFIGLYLAPVPALGFTLLGILGAALFAGTRAKLDAFGHLLFGLIMAGFAIRAWGLRLHSAARFSETGVTYWDWRGRAHEIPWDRMRSLSYGTFLTRLEVSVTYQGGSWRRGVWRITMDSHHAAVQGEIVRLITNRADLSRERTQTYRFKLGEMTVRERR